MIFLLTVMLSCRMALFFFIILDNSFELLELFLTNCVLTLPSLVVGTRTSMKLTPEGPAVVFLTLEDDASTTKTCLVLFFGKSTLVGLALNESFLVGL